MTGASINIGMRAAIYEKPLEPDRWDAIRGRPCGAALDVSIADSPSIVVNKPHASGPTIGLSMTDLRPGIRRSSNGPSQHQMELRTVELRASGPPETSRPNSWCSVKVRPTGHHIFIKREHPLLVYGARVSVPIGTSLLKAAPRDSAMVTF